MRNKVIQAIENEFMQSVKAMPAFEPGDTVVVQVKVKEGERTRLQSYEGIVIAKRNRGFNSAFTVRKISHGVGVERVFQSYSSALESVEVKRRGDVRRAKLYYILVAVQLVLKKSLPASKWKALANQLLFNQKKKMILSSIFFDRKSPLMRAFLCLSPML